MKRFITTISIIICCALQSFAQERTVQNRPYTDLRPFHFGVVVGTHFQDMELLNVGPQIITNEDGTTTEALITSDQDRWDTGFNVGVIGEFRLNTHFQFRVAPAMYFGTRHITFRDMKDIDPDGNPREQHQEMKSAYISSAFDIIFAAPRFGNHRPYLMGGLTPMINLSGKKSDYIKLKRYDLFAEVGLGCDFYLPFFKLRPELKFMYGLGNNLDTDHAKELRDKNMIKFTNSVKKATTKMIVLSFYFE
ncbi:MAG: porin family protein [Prevotella sp.]